MPVVEFWIALGSTVLLTVGFFVCLLLDKRRSVWVDRRFPGTGRTKLVFGDFAEAGRTEHRMYTTERLYRAFKARKLPVGGALMHMLPCVIVTDPQLIEHVLSDEFVKLHPAVCGMRTFRSCWDAFEDERFEYLVQVAKVESDSVTGLLLSNGSSVRDVKAISELIVVRTIARTVFGRRWDERQQLPLACGNENWRPNALWNVAVSSFPIIQRIMSFFYLDEPTLLEELVHFLEDACTSKPYFLQHLKTMESKGHKTDRIKFSHTKALLQELVQNVFYFASGTMIACLFELAHHPEVQASLHNELKRSGNAMLDKLDNVIGETLRKYPPVDEVSFVSAANNRLPGCDLVVPKNTRVTVPIYAIHRNAEHFPDPTRFNPARPTPHSSLYRPLGYRPHPIGANFATLLVRVALASLLTRCRVRPTAETLTSLQMSPTLEIPYPRGKITLLIEAV